MSKLLVASMVAIAVLIAWLLFANATGSVATPTAPTAAPSTVDASSADALDAPGQESAVALRTAAPEPTFAPDATPIADGSRPPPAGEMRSIRCRVVDADRRAPVPSCRVDLSQSGRSRMRFVTDEEGRFETAAVFEPGIVSVRNLPVLEGAEAQMQWTIRPESFTVDETTDASRPFEIDLVATPRVEITMEVRKPYGEVAKGASIYASSIVRGERASEGALSFNAILSCDPYGRSTIWVSREFSERCALNLRATHEQGVAPNVVVEPPLPPTRIVLLLDVGSYVHIRVVDARKEPVPGASVSVSELAESSGSIGYFENTDATGVLALSAVPPGRFEVSATDLATRRSKTQDVEIVAGRNLDLELELPDAELKLALRGRVVDERGGPLPGVDVRVSSSTEEQAARSDESGDFEVWMLPSDELFVGVGSRELDDIFEPTEARVAFGTTDFVVRRVRKIERRELMIRLVDRNTKRTIHAARVYTARRPYSDATHWIPRNGLTKVTITDRESAWIMFAARGYEPIAQPSRELLERPNRPEIVTIELAPGFFRALTFVDSETGDKLAGVAVIQPSGERSLSDADGDVYLRAREWPPPYRIVLDGYKSLEWDPNGWQDWRRLVKLEKR